LLSELHTDQKVLGRGGVEKRKMGGARRERPQASNSSRKKTGERRKSVTGEGVGLKSDLGEERGKGRIATKRKKGKSSAGGEFGAA